jgi:hypothetical protein
LLLLARQSLRDVLLLTYGDDDVVLHRGHEECLASAPDITNTLIPGRSSIRCAHRSAPFSRGILASVITKSIDRC